MIEWYMVSLFPSAFVFDSLQTFCYRSRRTVNKHQCVSFSEGPNIIRFQKHVHPAKQVKVQELNKKISKQLLEILFSPLILS